MTMEKRLEFIEEAKKLVGVVKWKDKARDINSAVDCVGLPLVLAKKLGYVDPSYDFTQYGRIASGFTLIEKLRTLLVEVNPIPFTKDKVGMIITVTDGIFPHHMGILSIRNGKLTMIHSSARTRGVMEEDFIGRWDGTNPQNGVITHGFIFKEWI